MDQGILSVELHFDFRYIESLYYGGVVSVIKRAFSVMCCRFHTRLIWHHLHLLVRLFVDSSKTLWLYDEWTDVASALCSQRPFLSCCYCEVWPEWSFPNVCDGQYRPSCSLSVLTFNLVNAQLQLSLQSSMQTFFNCYSRVIYCVNSRVQLLR